VEGSYLISEWLMGFLAGVMAAFACSTIISVVLMMVVGFDKPDPID
jgi:uncharacterized sodium:solute symporter family permease YidK